MKNKFDGHGFLITITHSIFQILVVLIIEPLFDHVLLGPNSKVAVVNIFLLFHEKLGTHLRVSYSSL